MTTGNPIDGFADRLRRREGGGMISGWIGTPSPLLAGQMAQEAFDSVLLDLQHGMHDVSSAAITFGHIRLAGKPALARIAVGDNATASRLLDAGASGIIAPMINSVAEAEAFVAATKYPPIGARSWGPSLALNHTGLTPAQYLATANDICVSLAMIETRAALAAVDDILAVEGLDGVFLGPSDLSIALSNGASLAPNGPEVDAALATVLARCRAHGKVASAFGSDGERAGHLLKLGYDLVIAGGDAVQIRSGARAHITAARTIAAS